LSANFIIAETEFFQRLIQKPYLQPLYLKIKDYIYPQLRQNPFFGINIKKLKGDLGKFYRCRIGNHRLFYTIDKNKAMVFVITLKDRKDSYQRAQS